MTQKKYKVTAIITSNKEVQVYFVAYLGDPVKGITYPDMANMPQIYLIANQYTYSRYLVVDVPEGTYDACVELWAGYPGKTGSVKLASAIKKNAVSVTTIIDVRINDFSIGETTEI